MNFINPGCDKTTIKYNQWDYAKKETKWNPKDKTGAWTTYWNCRNKRAGEGCLATLIIKGDKRSTSELFTQGPNEHRCEKQLAMKGIEFRTIAGTINEIANMKARCIEKSLLDRAKCTGDGSIERIR